MTQVRDMPEESAQAAEIRNVMVDKLRADGMITSQAVDEAFRKVPRERFVPVGTPLRVAYNADASVATKTNEHGATTKASVSFETFCLSSVA